MYDALTALEEQIDSDEIDCAPAEVAPPEFVAVPNSAAARAAFAEFYVDNDPPPPTAGCPTYGGVSAATQTRLLCSKLISVITYLDDAVVLRREADVRVLRRGASALLTELAVCAGARMPLAWARVEALLAQHAEILRTARTLLRPVLAQEYADLWLRDALQFGDEQADYLRAVRDGKRLVAAGATMIAVLRGDTGKLAA